MEKGYHLIFPEIIQNDLIARLSITEEQIISVLSCIVHQFNEYLSTEHPGVRAEVVSISQHLAENTYVTIGIDSPQLISLSLELEEKWAAVCDEIYLNTSIGELMSFVTTYRVVIGQTIASHRSFLERQKNVPPAS